MFETSFHLFGTFWSIYKRTFITDHVVDTKRADGYIMESIQGSTCAVTMFCLIYNLLVLHMPSRECYSWIIYFETFLKLSNLNQVVMAELGTNPGFYFISKSNLSLNSNFNTDQMKILNWLQLQLFLFICLPFSLQKFQSWKKGRVTKPYCIINCTGLLTCDSKFLIINLFNFHYQTWTEVHVPLSI